MVSAPVELIFNTYAPGHVPDTLYHYCSSETLMAIVDGRSIRLSALSMSNDSDEGRLVLRLTDKLGNQKQTMPALLASLKAHWDEVVAANEGLGFCLSERGDLLSQWRGYANQGRGVCIGFSTNALKRLSSLDEMDENLVTLEKVEYSELQQLHQYEPTFKALVRAIENAQGFLQYGQVSISDSLKAALNRELRPWTRKIYTFKNDGFSEEREWRLLSLLGREAQATCNYRATDEKFVAYKDLTYEVDAISHVILGPKHATPVDQVARMLQRKGITASVSKSSLTYR